ncbi:MAG TPA: DUF4197 domain-containing protein [Moheibacter sp.]|nr:DUF4197 domain-containing protein [Moheibacter sp.]
MKKNLFTLTLFSFALFGCSQMQQIASQLPATGTAQGVGGISNMKIADGLKQALELGVLDGVQKLGKKDGFWGDQMTRILLPKELQKVDQTLRSIGLGSLADEGVKLLNRAAEDAVTEAAPIFKDAIMGMNFQDAKGILLGPETAATQYLSQRTNQQLFKAFEPKVQASLGKVGADKIWERMITQYNNVSREKVNPNLTAYVTEQAIGSVFKMVEQKEIGIRNNIGLRTTPLLQEVFGLQDKR